MSRGKKGLFASVATVTLIFGSAPVSANHHLIGAVDNIGPDAPTNVGVALSADGSTVTLGWTRSASDMVGGVATGGGGANHMGSNIIDRNGVTKYFVYRRINETLEWGDALNKDPDAPTLVDVADDFGGRPDNTQGFSHPASDLNPLGSNQFFYGVSATDGTNESAIVSAGLPIQLGDAPSGSTISYDATGVTGRLAVALGTAALDEALTGASVDVAWSSGGDLTFVIDSDPTSGFGLITSSPYINASATPFINSSTVFKLNSENPNQTLFPAFEAALVNNFNGDYTGAVTFVTNDPALLSNVGLDLSATVAGAVAIARIDVSSPLSFGGVELGSSGEKNLVITNLGGVTLNIATIISADNAIFAVGDIPTTTLGENESVSVPITFTPADNIFYELVLTIISDDPMNPSTEVIAKGLGRVQGQGVKPVSRKIVKAKVTFPNDIDFTDPVAVTNCITDAKANIQARLAAGLLVINVNCSSGSTIVDFEIVADEEAAEPPVITVEDALAELIVAIEDPAVEVFPDLVTDLGAVDSVVDETEIVSLQPTDADGADIVGWFSRTGSRVDFDDFFVFAEGFGRTVDSEELDILDIAGPDQGPPDGVINFDDFFRFAQDFGKTVANAAEIQDLLG